MSMVLRRMLVFVSLRLIHEMILLVSVSGVPLGYYINYIRCWNGCIQKY